MKTYRSKSYISRLLVALALAALTAGCASSPTMESLAKDEARASEARDKAAEARKAKEQEHMEATLAKVPGWALEQPRPDDTGVYAIGVAESDKMRVAFRKAILEAEFGLAKIYNQEISGSERMYAQDNGGRVGQEQYTELIDKLVSQVPVVGFEVVHQEVKPIDGKYNAFVLVKLPYSQFNSVLKDQRAKTDDTSIIKAYDDLERRLALRRQQRIDEAAAAQNNAAAQPATAEAAKTVAD